MLPVKRRADERLQGISASSSIRTHMCVRSHLASSIKAEQEEGRSKPVFQSHIRQKRGQHRIERTEKEEEMLDGQKGKREKKHISFSFDASFQSAGSAVVRGKKIDSQ